MSSTSDHVDLDLVVAEIMVEAQRRRDSGEIPEGLERELDAEFARHAPPGVAGEDLEVLLDRAERASYVDVDVPTASRLPGVSQVKQVLRKLMAWYLRYVAQQVTVVGGTLTRAVRLVDVRVRHLEEGSLGGGPLRAELDRAEPAPLDEGVAGAVVAALTGADGRVLVGACGRGELVRRLRAEGVGAYGVEARRGLLAEALRDGLDVRPDDLADHLRALPDKALGGLVLTDVVEWFPPAALVALVQQASRVLAPGGRIAVASTTPEAWARRRPAVQVDLAPGRPLHAETWEALLAHRGFIDVGAVVTPATATATAEVPTVARVAGDDPVSSALNANAAALEHLLASVSVPPSSFVVQARRPS